jgi:hypothetical protein
LRHALMREAGPDGTAPPKGTLIRQPAQFLKSF